MNEEEKLLIKKAEDVFRLCDKYSSPRFSAFYNESEISLVSEHIKNKYGYNISFFGGYEGSERKILGVFPEWDEAREDTFPIVLLKVKAGYDRELSHRDYLGSVLGLGLDRTKVGDILTKDKEAYIFVMEDVKEYILNNLTKVSNCGVKVEVEDTLPKKFQEKEYEFINGVSASVRLDAVVASALNISRKNSSLYILGGKVSVNHKLIEDVAYTLKEGDLMSIKGYGRVYLEKIGEKTRSGRIHILLKKCVR